MTENYRALIAVLFFALPTLWLLRRPMTTAGIIAPGDFKRRATIWVLITLVLFLSQNFWLFSAVTLLLVLLGRTKDGNVLGFYFFLLFAAPPIPAAIEGFGGINYLIAVDHYRILAFAVLMPTALSLAGRPDRARWFKLPTDKYVLGYVVLMLALQAPLTSFTDFLRTMLLHVVDILLPYYVFSRSVSDLGKIRDAAGSFVVACALLSPVAVYEWYKGWLLYASLPNFMGVPWAYGHYLFRGGTVILRASVSMGHSIVLGYAMAVAMGLHLMLRSRLRPAAWRAILLVLIAGSIAALSRGPWVGAFAVLAVGLAMGPGAPMRIGKFGLALVLVAGVMAVTPWGPAIIAYLPFVGEVDAGNVEYRQHLFQVAFDVMLQNPWLGTPHFMSFAAIEQLRTGEGIIDVVNSYLGVGLVSGFVGLFLFCGAFASAVVRLIRQVVGRVAIDSETQAVGRALLASVVGVLIIIATCSSINAVPVIYWSLLGLCAGYLRLTGPVTVRLPSAGAATSRPLGTQSS